MHISASMFRPSAREGALQLGARADVLRNDIASSADRLASVMGTLANADSDDAFVARTLAFIDARSGTVSVTGAAVDVLTWRLGRGTPSSVLDEHGNPPGAPPAW